MRSAAVILAAFSSVAAFATVRPLLPPDILSIARRGAQTNAERALLRAAATRYDVPSLASDGKCTLCPASSALQYSAQYTNSQRGFLSALLGRQSMQHSIVSPSGHFRVHYDTSGVNAPDLTDINGNGVPDYIDLVAVVFDSVWQFEVGILTYPAPPSDAGLGGGNELDVYVEEMSVQGGYYGYTERDANNELPKTGPTHRYPSYITIDNNFAEPYYSSHGSDAVRVTAAHEFFHTIQIGGYGLWDMPFVNDCDASGGLANRWFFEMSSVWMETIVYTGIRDFLHSSIPALFMGCAGKPFHGLEDVQLGVTPCCDLGYSLVLFFLYLQHHFNNDHSFVQEVWQQETTTHPLQAIDNTLHARGFTLTDAWCDFTRALLFTGTRAVDTLNYFDSWLPDSLPIMHLRHSQSSVPSQIADSAHVMSAVYYAFGLSATRLDSLYVVITNRDTSRGFNRDISLQPFQLDIGAGYSKPVPCTNLTYQYSPNEVQWCALLSCAQVDESGTQPPFPEPFIVDGQSQIFFPVRVASRPKTLELRIYTESGALAFASTAATPETRSGKLGVSWNGRRNDGELVHSGVYLFSVGTGSDALIGKIAVVRK